MKNKKTGDKTGVSLQSIYKLPGYSNGKKAKASRFVKYRAIVFDRQMSGNYEIIF
jgi:hypothetical protein